MLAIRRKELPRSPPQEMTLIKFLQAPLSNLQRLPQGKRIKKKERYPLRTWRPQSMKTPFNSKTIPSRKPMIPRYAPISFVIYFLFFFQPSTPFSPFLGKYWSNHPNSLSVEEQLTNYHCTTSTWRGDQYWIEFHKWHGRGRQKYCACSW